MLGIQRESRKVVCMSEREPSRERVEREPRESRERTERVEREPRESREREST